MPPSPPPAAAAAPDQPTCSIEDLPDFLLGHIMVLAGEEHGPNMTLVSHRWRRLAYAEPQLWHTFRATDVYDPDPENPSEEELQKAALLQRVGRHAVRLVWKNENYAAEFSLIPCLAAMNPSRLVELELWYCSKSFLEAAGAALRRLTGITSLIMHAEDSSGAPLTLTLAALGSSLRRLLNPWDTHTLTTAGLGSIVQLAQLTHLSLRAFCWPPIGSLTRLSCLKRLVLEHAGEDALQVPEPCTFPGGLQHFRFITDNLDGLQIGDCEPGLMLCQLWQGTISDLEALPEIYRKPLRTYRLPTLMLKCADHSMPSLSRLLRAAQPAGMEAAALQRLELHGFLPPPAALRGCTQLQQLRELSLQGGIGGGICGPTPEFEALGLALPVLLQQASSLSALETSNSDFNAKPGIVPDCLLSYSRLTRLSLESQGLTDLPTGEYLTDLRVLSLADNLLTRLPPTLSTATALTCLDISYNPELRFCEAGIDTLLALPLLQCLKLRGIQAADPSLLRELQERLPHLTLEPPPPPESAESA